MNARIFGLVLLLVFLRVTADESSKFVTLSTVTELLTEVKYRITLFEFKNNLRRFMLNSHDNEYLVTMRVNPSYVDNITLKFIEPLYDILDNTKAKIHAVTTELTAKISQPESDIVKMLYPTTLQEIDGEWDKLSTDSVLTIQSTKELNSVLESIKKHIALNKNTVNHVISNLQTRSELIYSVSQDLGQARKRLEQISTDSSEIIIKHPRSNHILIESILEEQNNLQLDRQKLIVNCTEYSKLIDSVAKDFTSTAEQLEHLLITAEQFLQEKKTAIRRRENYRAEISELSEIILNNKHEIQVLRKQQETRHIIKEEIEALKPEIENAKQIATYILMQEISGLRFLTLEETRKLLQIPEEIKCMATLQPSSSENSTITLTLLQSGMCSKE